jgi:hypothetical protein
VETDLPRSMGLERRSSGRKLVQDNAQRVDQRRWTRGRPSIARARCSPPYRASYRIRMRQRLHPPAGQGRNR